MKKVLFLFILYRFCPVNAQELFVFSEPASNMPAEAVSLKMSAMLAKSAGSNRYYQRYSPAVLLGLSRKWMVYGSTSFSNMHRQQIRWEAARLYAKWRFLSVDDVQKHFRMAAFTAAAYSRNHPNFNEINLSGDHSGIQAGLIATQLWHKLAISGTLGLDEVLHKYRWTDTHRDMHAFSAISYAVSAGYLLLPFTYTDFDQTNLNLYLELLGSRNLDWPQERYFIDLAPSVQLIFNSTAKLNFGYRFQLAGDINRLSEKIFMLSFEYLFLNALKRQRN